jgi:hypothetical protein
MVRGFWRDVSPPSQERRPELASARARTSCTRPRLRARAHDSWGSAHRLPRSVASSGTNPWPCSPGRRCRRGRGCPGRRVVSIHETPHCVSLRVASLADLEASGQATRRARRSRVRMKIPPPSVCSCGRRMCQITIPATASTSASFTCRVPLPTGGAQMRCQWDSGGDQHRDRGEGAPAEAACDRAKAIAVLLRAKCGDDGHDEEELPADEERHGQQMEISDERHGRATWPIAGASGCRRVGTRSDQGSVVSQLQRRVVDGCQPREGECGEHESEVA